MSDQQVTRITRSVIVAVSDTALRQAIVTRLALASGLEVEVREGYAEDIAERDVVIATPPDCSPRAYRELVQRGVRVILISAAHPPRPHRHYVRAGLRSCVSIRDLWGEGLLKALRQTIEGEEQAAP
ncbi:MAG: hypothetical protein Kow0010_03170 [Dehalococcoidia bacterium]